jgi:membrane associated rhomboid family serine protease
LLFLIPLRGEDERRVPVVTSALILLNVAVFAWTSRVAVQRATAAEAELERVAEWTVRMAADEAPSLAAVARDAPSTLALLETDARWRQEVRGEETRERLEAVLDDYRRLRASHPFHRYGFVPAEVTPGRLLAHQFLHADGLHLLFNMLFLWAVGGALEASLGPHRLLLTYLAGGVAAALAHAAGHLGSAEPAIGASGAVAALVGAFAMVFRGERVRLALVAVLFAAPRILVVAWPAWIFPGLWLLEQLFYISLGTALRIAFLAHVGGFAFGAAVGPLLRPAQA